MIYQNPDFLQNSSHVIYYSQKLCNCFWWEMVEIEALILCHTQSHNTPHITTYYATKETPYNTYNTTYDNTLHHT